MKRFKAQCLSALSCIGLVSSLAMPAYAHPGSFHSGGPGFGGGFRGGPGPGFHGGFPPGRFGGYRGGWGWSGAGIGLGLGLLAGSAMYNYGGYGGYYSPPITTQVVPPGYVCTTVPYGGYGAYTTYQTCQPAQPYPYYNPW